MQLGFKASTNISRPCWGFFFFLPDFGHHQTVLHHECVTNGSHHCENVLAGRIPPHQVQQGIRLLLRVQFVDAFLCYLLHWNPAVILQEMQSRRLNNCSKQIRSKKLKYNMINYNPNLVCIDYNNLFLHRLFQFSNNPSLDAKFSLYCYKKLLIQLCSLIFKSVL